MALTANQKTNFINDVRRISTQLLRTVEEAVSLGRMSVQLDTGSSIGDADFTGNNAGITDEEMDNALGSLAAINTFVADGNHDDNLYKMNDGSIGG
jgi:hypothetical protein